MNEIKTHFDSQVLLSVIMPVYNGEKYIEEAVLSVLNQPEKDLVLIVINDGSIDNTQELIDRIAENDDRLIKVQQKNCGVSVARNKGIVKSLEIGARYLAFLDSDDVWCKDFYCKNTVELLNSGKFDLIGFDYYKGTEDLSKGFEVLSIDKLPEGLVQLSQHFSSYIYSSLIIQENKLLFPEGTKLSEDVIFFMIYNYYCNNYINVHECMFIYRDNPGSVTHQNKNKTILNFFSYLQVWDWVIAKIGQDVSVIEQCKAYKRAFLIEFIQQSCNYGKKLSWIQRKIKDLNEGESILYDNSIWTNDDLRQVLDTYLKYPKLFWIKYRVQGLFLSFRHIFRKIRIVNNLYNRSKNYKYIEEMHY